MLLNYRIRWKCKKGGTDIKLKISNFNKKKGFDLNNLIKSLINMLLNIV